MIEGKGAAKTCMETNSNVTKPAILAKGKVSRVEKVHWDEAAFSEQEEPFLPSKKIEPRGMEAIKNVFQAMKEQNRIWTEEECAKQIDGLQRISSTSDPV